MLHRRPIAFDLLVAEEVERLRSLAPERYFRFDLERVLPAGDADPDRVAQIVANLVGNAIKYSSGGGPIAITTARAGNAARLDIADEGISIPAEVLPTVFDHDRRVERGAARAVRGSGLRLSIVRQLAHLQRGQAWDDSEEGAGSVFHVTLPLAVPE